MSWGQKLRTMWPFGTQTSSEEAIKALRDAQVSASRAASDRAHAARLRGQTEEAVEQVRQHNTANRYDEFLRRVVQGRE
jgi:hypothetical protein